MATTKRPNDNDEDEIPSVLKGSLQDRIAAFAMLDAMTNKTQAEKSMRLKLIGFSNVDIAAMLQTTPAVVGSNIWSERKKTAKKAPPRKGSTSAGEAQGA